MGNAHDCASPGSDDLAELVLRYNALRQRGDSFAAARLRDGVMVPLAVRMKTAPIPNEPEVSFSHWGMIPNAARGCPEIVPANENSSPSIGPSIA